MLIVLRILWTAGAQRIAVNEYHWLRRLGYDVKLIFLRKGNARGYEELLSDVDYAVVREGHGPLTPLLYLGTKSFARDRGIESTVDLDLIAKVPGIARREGADYLVCHDQFAGIGCLRAKEKHGIPYSVFIHERVVRHSAPILGGLVDDLERRVLAGAARVLAVTDKVASTIREKHGIAAEPNYPGMDRISDVPFGRRGRRLIAVSFWDWGRRPEDYLRLVESLDDYTLLMVGNWRVKGAKERFLEEVRKRGMDGRVLLMEGVPEGELGKLYDSSMFAVRFGYGEYGPAMITIEAIQHTLPLIINDELGTADLVRQCGAGLVTRGVDLERIKEFIRNVDEATYDALQNNIRRLQAKYTWERHVRKLVA